MASIQEKLAESPLVELSAKKWQWMADKNVEELAKLFHQDAMFVHMGGREVSFPFFVSEAYTKTDAGWQLVTLAFTKKM